MHGSSRDMFGESISKFLKLDNLIGHITGYFETKVELVKVDAKQQLADGLSKALTFLLISFVFALVILFLSLGVAIVLATHFGDFIGFGLVALFYVIVGVVLILSKDKLNNRFKKELSESLNKK